MLSQTPYQQPTPSEIFDIIEQLDTAGENYLNFDNYLDFLRFCLVNELSFLPPPKTPNRPTNAQMYIAPIVAHLGLHLFDLKDEPTVNKFRQFLGATSIWNSKADLTQLHGKVLKSAHFALENTPSEFLTDSNYQQKFQNLFMSLSPRALFREIMSTYLILGFYSKTSTEVSTS